MRKNVLTIWVGGGERGGEKGRREGGGEKGRGDERWGKEKEKGSDEPLGL